MACCCNNSYYSLPCCCPPAVVGTTTTTTTTLCPDAIPCEEAYLSDCIIYNGPDLTCYGITSGSSVTEILNIIIAQLDPCTTTTTSTTTACVRPTGLTTYTLNTAINGVSFSANLEEACTAYNQYATNPGGNTLTGISGQGSSLSYGSVIYNGEDGDCTLVPNGYYIINGQPGVVTMINGVVNAYNLCLTTTTSTTTTSSTTTTTTVDPSITTTSTTLSPNFIVKTNNSVTNVINSVTPSFYSISSGSFPVNSGQTLNGFLTSGGTSVTINYTSTVGPTTQILLIKNNITVGNDAGIPNGTNLNYTYNIPWLITDTIEIRLNNY